MSKALSKALRPCCPAGATEAVSRARVVLKRLVPVHSERSGGGRVGDPGAVAHGVGQAGVAFHDEPADGDFASVTSSAQAHLPMGSYLKSYSMRPYEISESDRM